MRVTGFEQRAQSNTQLYAQLLAGGWCMKDVGRVRDAYALAARLFAGQLRPDGRPFVCHLVGVASILAMLGAAPDTIIAGLLHSAYTHGDFGLGRGQMTRKARERLRAAAGPQIERLVAVYSRHPWNASTVATWVENAGTLAADERQIIVIRLADVVEDALDHGLQLSAKMENPNRAISVESLVIPGECSRPAATRSLRCEISCRKETRGWT